MLKKNFVWVLVVLLLTNVAYAGDYGYEKLDNGSVLHMWNPALSYYFNATSGLQFTNHYNEYWSKNIFCVGWYDGGWNDKCNNGTVLTSFKWTITTDNNSYVTAEGKKNMTFAGETVEARLNYTLNENQDDLIIKPSLENVDTSDITEDIRFGWKVKDINVGGSYYDNLVNIGINNDFLNLSNTSNEKYTSLSAKQYLITNDEDWMRYKWVYNNYTLYVRNEVGQFNAPITLILWDRGLNVGQKKATNLLWIDATCILTMVSETPNTNDTFWDGNITYNFGGCVEPDTSCPIDEACDNTLTIQSKAEGQTWTQRTTDFAENRECPNNLTYPINLVMEHNNKTDWRLIYRAFGLGEVACEEIFNPPPRAPYRKEVRFDYWWNANTPNVSGVEVIDENGNQTCKYSFNDGDGDNEENTTITWYLQGRSILAQFANETTMDNTNPDNICCVDPGDDVFITTNETEVCSGEFNQDWLLAILLSVMGGGAFLVVAASRLSDEHFWISLIWNGAALLFFWAGLSILSEFLTISGDDVAGSAFIYTYIFLLVLVLGWIFWSFHRKRTPP